jgi:hypothetical protein
MNQIKHKMMTAIAIICFLSSAQWSFGQAWNFNNSGNGWVGYTTNGVTGIGIGDFQTANTNIASALHINTSLTTPQTGSGAFGLAKCSEPIARMLYPPSGAC